jgi:copper chaperone CopZ
MEYDISPKEGEAEIAYDPDKTSPKQIADAVSETGFKAQVKGEKKG